MKQKTKKVAAYTVSGITFLGAVTGLLLNMTRLGDSLSNESPGLVQIMPTLIQEVPPVAENVDPDLQHSVVYNVDKTGSGLEIDYATSVMDVPFKSVGMLGEGPFFALPKIGIDIKLVNNTNEAIFVTDAVINVSESWLNSDPLLVSIQHDGIVGYLTWLNDGWAEPEAISASVRIAGTDTETIELPFLSEPDALIDATIYNFDIAPILSKAGIDVDAYRTARAYDEDDENAISVWKDIKATCIREFGDLNDVAEFLELITGEPVNPSDITDQQIGSAPVSCSVMLDGLLTMTWINEGALQTREQSFVISVMVTPPDGLGSAGFQPTGLYDVKLRPKGAAYTIKVPISQPVPPKGFDRFVLWVGAEKSSIHDLEVTLKYNQDGEIVTPPIRINYLRPRSTVISRPKTP